MNFNFGKYKNEDVYDVAKKDPNYLNWILSNCRNMDDDLFLEIYQAYKSTDDWEKSRARSEMIKMDYERISKYLTGKYYKNKNFYIYIRKVSINELFPDKISLYVLWVFNASKRKCKVCTNFDRENETSLVDIGHMYLTDLLYSYDECTKEEFENNYNGAIEKIKLTAKI